MGVFSGVIGLSTVIDWNGRT